MFLRQIEDFENRKNLCFEHPLRRDHYQKSFDSVVHKASIPRMRVLEVSFEPKLVETSVFLRSYFVSISPNFVTEKLWVCYGW